MHPLFYLYAGLNSIFFPLRSRIGWKGRDYYESPAVSLPSLTDRQKEIICALKKKYNVQFESSLNATNTLRNYHTLCLLDQVASRWGWKLKDGIRLLDVGSKNFYYAASLHAFFKPSRLTGIELDGYHLYRGFYANASCGEFYAAQLPHTIYRVINFKDDSEPVDGILWFFPFVRKDDLVTWYLPTNQFEPRVLFNHARDILTPGGFLFMVNTDDEEFTLASDFLNQVGFLLAGMEIYTEGLLPKEITPYVTLWSVPPHTPSPSAGTLGRNEC